MKALAERPKRYGETETRVGKAIIEVKFGVDSIRTLQASLLQVAYLIASEPGLHGYLVLVDAAISADRLREEWARAAAIMHPKILSRITLCLHSPKRMAGIPEDPDEETRRILLKVVEESRKRTNPVRTDYSFVIQKLLLLQWLTAAEPVTSEWLARKAGCSYPAVARALNSLGSLVERQSDRRVNLRWFPRDEFARLLAIADRARSTTRFADHSGQPRSVESHLRRLEKINPPTIAVGGVLGARHYYTELDLAGTPRLDLSVHCPNQMLNLEFVERLDPALKLVEDPFAPANVVVHAIRHADPLFVAREGGLAWVDPLECLFDLHEARLDAQAGQFLHALERRRTKKK